MHQHMIMDMHRRRHRPGAHEKNLRPLVPSSLYMTNRIRCLTRPTPSACYHESPSNTTGTAAEPPGLCQVEPAGTPSNWPLQHPCSSYVSRERKPTAASLCQNTIRQLRSFAAAESHRGELIACTVQDTANSSTRSKPEVPESVISRAFAAQRDRQLVT